MIFSAFLVLSGAIITIIASVLPTSSGFPTEVSSAVVTMAQYAKVLDLLLPVSTLAQIIALVLSVEVGIFAFKSFRWLISHIPFIGGRG